MFTVTSSSFVRDIACLSSSFLELTAMASSCKSKAFSVGRITNAELKLVEHYSKKTVSAKRV